MSVLAGLISMVRGYLLSPIHETPSHSHLSTPLPCWPRQISTGCRLLFRWAAFGDSRVARTYRAAKKALNEQLACRPDGVLPVKGGELILSPHQKGLHMRLSPNTCEDQRQPAAWRMAAHHRSLWEWLSVHDQAPVCAKLPPPRMKRGRSSWRSSRGLSRRSQMPEKSRNPSFMAFSEPSLMSEPSLVGTLVCSTVDELVDAPATAKGPTRVSRIDCGVKRHLRERSLPRGHSRSTRALPAKKSQPHLNRKALSTIIQPEQLTIGPDGCLIGLVQRKRSGCAEQVAHSAVAPDPHSAAALNPHFVAATHVSAIVRRSGSFLKQRFKVWYEVDAAQNHISVEWALAAWQEEEQACSSKGDTRDQVALAKGGADWGSTISIMEGARDGAQEGGEPMQQKARGVDGALQQPALQYWTLPGDLRLAIAWAVNITLFLMTLFLIGMKSIASVEPIGSLKVWGLTTEQWADAVLGQFLLACLQTFLFIDGTKAGLLALTAALANNERAITLLPKNTLRRSVFLSPFRRLHHVLELIS